MEISYRIPLCNVLSAMLDAFKADRTFNTYFFYLDVVYMHQTQFIRCLVNYSIMFIKLDVYSHQPLKYLTELSIRTNFARLITCKQNKGKRL